jgi:hypothetical protein
MTLYSGVMIGAQNKRETAIYIYIYIYIFIYLFIYIWQFLVCLLVATYSKLPPG